MRRLLHPRSVAVVGASRDPAALGRIILENLSAFQGPVYAVNPAAAEIAARPCYARLADAPGQAGVIRTDTLEDLFDVVSLLATQPVPAGPRVAVVTNAGGPGILLADACEALGMTLPELTLETQARLRGFLPTAAGVRNPVDLIASAGPEAFERAVAAVGQDPQVDALVVIYVPPRVTQPEQVAAAVARGAGEVPAAKPILTVFLSSRGAPPVLASGPRGQLPEGHAPGWLACREGHASC